eukprot:199945-Prymnesium_polylepis.2
MPYNGIGGIIEEFVEPFGYSRCKAPLSTNASAPHWGRRLQQQLATASAARPNPAASSHAARRVAAAWACSAWACSAARLSARNAARRREGSSDCLRAVCVRAAA